MRRHHRVLQHEAAHPLARLVDAVAGVGPERRGDADLVGVAAGRARALADQGDLRPVLVGRGSRSGRRRRRSRRRGAASAGSSRRSTIGDVHGAPPAPRGSRAHAHVLARRCPCARRGRSCASWRRNSSMRAPGGVEPQAVPLLDDDHRAARRPARRSTRPGASAGERRETHGGEHGRAGVDSRRSRCRAGCRTWRRGDHPEHRRTPPARPPRPTRTSSSTRVLGEAARDRGTGGRCQAPRPPGSVTPSPRNTVTSRPASSARHGRGVVPGGRRRDPRPSAARSKTSTASNSTGSPAGVRPLEVDLDEDDGPGDNTPGSVRRGGPGARRGPSGSGSAISSRRRRGRGADRVDLASGGEHRGEIVARVRVDRREVALDAGAHAHDPSLFSVRSSRRNDQLARSGRRTR